MLANSDEFGLWNLMIGHRNLEYQIAVDDGQTEVEAVTSRSRGLIVRFADHSPSDSVVLEFGSAIGIFHQRPVIFVQTGN